MFRPFISTRPLKLVPFIIISIIVQKLPGGHLRRQVAEWGSLTVLPFHNPVVCGAAGCAGTVQAGLADALRSIVIKCTYSQGVTPRRQLQSILEAACDDGTRQNPFVSRFDSSWIQHNDQPPLARRLR